MLQKTNLAGLGHIIRCRSANQLLTKTYLIPVVWKTWKFRKSRKPGKVGKLDKYGKSRKYGKYGMYGNNRNLSPYLPRNQMTQVQRRKECPSNLNAY